MPVTPDSVADVARAIQLALAPVFLLTGIAGLLNVMAGRLARIIDRGRMISQDQTVRPERESVEAELRSLELRRHFTSYAITASTIAALLLCLVVATLFFEAMLDVRLSWLVGGLFTTSTLALTVGLAYFLREVHLSTQIRLSAPKPAP